MRKAQNITLEGDEDERDVELTDSDDDATWTPFKGGVKGPGGAGSVGGVRNDVDYDDEEEEEEEDLEEEDDDDDDDDDDEDDDYRRNHRRKQPSSASASSSSTSLPPPTRVVPESVDFRPGDFMVLKADAGKDNVPIWRMDTKTLLQRYNPAQGSKGQWLYRSANLFTNYSPENRCGTPCLKNSVSTMSQHLFFWLTY